MSEIFDKCRSKSDVKRWYTNFDSVSLSVVKYGYLLNAPRIKKLFMIMFFTAKKLNDKCRQCRSLMI